MTLKKDLWVCVDWFFFNHFSCLIFFMSLEILLSCMVPDMQRWAAILQNVLIKATPTHSFFGKKSNRDSQFNTNKTCAMKWLKQPQNIFLVPVKRNKWSHTVWYNQSIQKSELKAKKKGWLIIKLVLKKGRYNRPIHKLDLENWRLYWLIQSEDESLSGRGRTIGHFARRTCI